MSSWPIYISQGYLCMTTPIYTLHVANMMKNSVEYISILFTTKESIKDNTHDQKKSIIF